MAQPSVSLVQGEPLSDPSAGERRTSGVLGISFSFTCAALFWGDRLGNPHSLTYQTLLGVSHSVTHRNIPRARIVHETTLLTVRGRPRRRRSPQEKHCTDLANEGRGGERRGCRPLETEPSPDLPYLLDLLTLY